MPARAEARRVEGWAGELTALGRRVGRVEPRRRAGRWWGRFP